MVWLRGGLSGLEPPGSDLELDIHEASRPETHALAQNPQVGKESWFTIEEMWIQETGI